MNPLSSRGATIRMAGLTTLIVVGATFPLWNSSYWIRIATGVALWAGLGSVLGVLAAGLFLGVLQALTTTYIGADYTLMVVFVVLSVALLIFPHGITRSRAT